MEWINEDVSSDGSCFYRSLYKAAHHYHGGSLVYTIYECFGKKFSYVRDDEEDFVEIIRETLGNKIESGIYDLMVEKQKKNVLANTHIQSKNAREAQSERTVGLYETLVSWANTDYDMYKLIVSELSTQFQEKFKDKNNILSMDKDEFYSILSSLVKRKKVYASEYDITIVSYILDECGIFLNMIRNKNECLRTKNKMKALNVQRVNENHYHAWYEKIHKGGKRRTRRSKKGSRKTRRR